MKNKLLNEIKELIEKQPKEESISCYDDHGNYYNEGYYDGYIEALETILKIIEKEEN